MISSQILTSQIINEHINQTTTMDNTLELAVTLNYLLTTAANNLYSSAPSYHAQSQALTAAQQQSLSSNCSYLQQQQQPQQSTMLTQLAASLFTNSNLFNDCRQQQQQQQQHHHQHDQVYQNLSSSNQQSQFQQQLAASQAAISAESASALATAAALAMTAGLPHVNEKPDLTSLGSYQSMIAQHLISQKPMQSNESTSSRLLRGKRLRNKDDDSNVGDNDKQTNETNKTATHNASFDESATTSSDAYLKRRPPKYGEPPSSSQVTSRSCNNYENDDADVYVDDDDDDDDDDDVEDTVDDYSRKAFQGGTQVNSRSSASTSASRLLIDSQTSTVGTAKRQQAASNLKKGQSKRSRTFIDPITEVPCLENWFKDNSHPDASEIARFTHHLNRLPYRSRCPLLEDRNLVFWFKNRRAKAKRR